jgi:hypothetical protein
MIFSHVLFLLSNFWNISMLKELSILELSGASLYNLGDSRSCSTAARLLRDYPELWFSLSKNLIIIKYLVKFSGRRGSARLFEVWALLSYCLTHALQQWELLLYLIWLRLFRDRFPPWGTWLRFEKRLCMFEQWRRQCEILMVNLRQKRVAC